MSGLTLPISMLASKGPGGALAAGVIGLLIILALTSRRDPTAPTTPAPSAAPGRR